MLLWSPNDGVRESTYSGGAFASGYCVRRTQSKRERDEKRRPARACAKQEGTAQFVASSQWTPPVPSGAEVEASQVVASSKVEAIDDNAEAKTVCH